MTREQKIEWLTNASVEDLLNQYEVSARNASDPFETVKKDSRYTIEGIFEDYKLVREEIKKRMGC